MTIVRTATFYRSTIATVGRLAAVCSLAAACGNGSDARSGDTGSPTITEGFIETSDGVRLFYERVGSGPAFVVAPMAAYLSGALRALARPGRTLVFYDPRNRGRSGAAGLDSVSLDHQLRDLDELRAALAIDRMSLIGWSGLGMEMAAYAIRHPGRVARLVQISPVPPRDGQLAEEGGDTRSRRVDQAAVSALDARADAGEFDSSPAEYCRLRSALTRPGNFVDPALAERVPDLCVHPNEWPVNLFPYFGALLGSFTGYDWLPDLEELAVPRLVIHGLEDGIPVAGARSWVQGFDQARLLVVSPAGHFPFIEQAEVTLEAIDVFLDGSWPDSAVALPGR
jgi:proline iminopeptidase